MVSGRTTAPPKWAWVFSIQIKQVAKEIVRLARRTLQRRHRQLWGALDRAAIRKNVCGLPVRRIEERGHVIPHGGTREVHKGVLKGPVRDPIERQRIGKMQRDVITDGEKDFLSCVE